MLKKQSSVIQYSEIKKAAIKKSAVQCSAIIEQEFRTLLAHVPTAAQGYASDGTVLYWNSASERLYGYTAAEALGKNVLELIIPAELRPAVELGMRQMLETGVVVPSEELSLVRKDGSRVVVFSSHYLVRAPSGELELFGIDVDLTELKLSQERLQASEERFQTLIEAMPDAIFLKDGQGCWQIINESANRLFQLGNFPWLGATDLEMSKLRPDFEPTLRACLENDEKAWQARKLMQFSESMPVETGETLAYEVLKSPIFDEDGERKALVVVARDVTERKKWEAELRIAATAFESQQGMFVTDQHFVILRVNSTFSAITGYSAAEAIGKKPRELLNSGCHDANFFAAIDQSLELNGSWQGEIWDRRKNGELFPEWMALTAVRDLDGVLTHYVAAFTDATRRKAAEEQIKHLAFFDALTALPNRRLLMDRLQQAIASSARRKTYCAMLFVDLDHFKFLNDTHGHFLGDQLLVQVAERIVHSVPEANTVARLGGDEFVVVLEDLSEHETEAAASAKIVGEKIRTALKQSYLIGGVNHHSSASIGVTLFDGREPSIGDPLKRADLAMYQAKAAGRNALRFFDPQMQAIVAERAVLEAGLREALGAKQLLLHYQPQISQGKLTGVEALVRWQHPEQGLILPGVFIGLAEENDLILPIGKWVLTTACEQLVEWANQAQTKELSMSVNVSMRQLHQDGFVAEVLEVLQKTGARADRLKLELTESVFAASLDDVIQKMTALRAHGVGFSLDDFGTGYSSLSHLKRLPLDQLKIDQSFVRDILSDAHDAAIAQMIIALGGSLGLAVIAEGVETEAQREFLAAQGCSAFQGHLVSPAVSSQELQRVIAKVQ